MDSSEQLSGLVGDYLSYLYERYPTAATLDGVHTYDDLVEDLSRPALEAQARDLRGLLRRVDAIAPARLTRTERLERRVIEANLRGRVFGIETIRSWEVDPQYHADLLATSLAAQVVFPYAPLAERARRVLAKLQQVPRFLEVARDTVRDAPLLFVKVGIETLEGLARFIEGDLGPAFAELEDQHLLAELVDAAGEASGAVHGYVGHLREELAPRSRASFRLGRARFEEKLRLEGGVATPADRLLAIGLRELRATQEEFLRVAGRLDGADARDAWQRAKARHPAAGELVPVVQGQLADLAAFIKARGVVSMPEGPPVVVAPTPPFYRWTFASMWTPGPFEARPGRACYFVTDVDAGWPAERQEQHLRDLNCGTLWAISIHEVFPGHFLHYQHLRQVASALRKSIMFSATSFVEGWAHYCEQMMLEAGFGDGDPDIALGQLAEALVRLARLIVGIRLHTEDLSVEEGVRLFREEAFLEEATARREAERGTFDPSYVVYAVGKLMLLKLRDDCRVHHGNGHSLRAFHDAVLANGTVPLWAHRQLMLGENDDGVLL